MGKFKAGEEQSFEGVPPEIYNCYIEEASYVHKSGDKKPYLKLKLVVLEGEYEGWPIFDQLYDTPEAQWKFASLVHATGLAQDPEFEFDTETLHELVNGQFLQVKTKVEKYENEERTKVQRYTKHPQVKEQLEAKAAEAAAATPPAAAAAPAAPPAPPAAPAAAAPPASPAAPTKPTPKLPSPPSKKKISV
jgi:hypothetical protein